MAKATYAYDQDGRMTSVAYPSYMGAAYSTLVTGTPYNYAYDVAGRPNGLTQTASGTTTTIVDSVKYNAASQLTDWQENGSNVMHREYDPARGWLTKILAASSLNLQYSYLDTGQVSTVTDSVNPGQAVTAYTYDNLNRLSLATTPNWNLAWTYDDFGNRLTQTGSAASGQPAVPTSSLTYDTTNYTNQITTTGYTYDAAGNLTNMPDGTSITYDGTFNRATTIAKGSTSRTMKYDANGRRIAKVDASSNTTTIYFTDPGGRQLVTIVYNPTNGSFGTVGSTDVHFAGQRIGQWTDRVGSMRAGGAASHYYPYGEEVTGTGNDAYKYAELYRDSDSGFDYANSRYYANGVGRFLTPDSYDASASPMSPQSWNRYSYVEGDPVNHYDPSGRLLAWVGDCGENWISDASLSGPCDLSGWGYFAAIMLGAAGSPYGGDQAPVGPTTNAGCRPPQPNTTVIDRPRNPINVDPQCPSAWPMQKAVNIDIDPAKFVNNTELDVSRVLTFSGSSTATFVKGSISAPSSTSPIEPFGNYLSDISASRDPLIGVDLSFTMHVPSGPSLTLMLGQDVGSFTVTAKYSCVTSDGKLRTMPVTWNVTVGVRLDHPAPRIPIP